MPMRSRSSWPAAGSAGCAAPRPPPGRSSPPQRSTLSRSGAGADGCPCCGGCCSPRRWRTGNSGDARNHTGCTRSFVRYGCWHIICWAADHRTPSAHSIDRDTALSRTRQAFLIAAGWLAHSLGAGPGLADQVIHIDAGRLSLCGDRGFQLVRLDGGVLQPVTGSPMVPELARNILLPPGCEAAGIEIIPAVPETIRLSAPLLPCPAPATVGAGEPTATGAMDPSIYRSDQPFPGALARLTGQGSMAGYRFASIAISPVQYIPAKNILLYHRSLGIRVKTRRTPPATMPPSGRSQAFRRMAGLIAADPANLARYDDGSTGHAAGPVPLAPHGADDPYEYLIVTSARLAPALAPLARWKTDKGVRARIMLTDSIAAAFPGADPAERLRACIKRERDRSGIGWVLLAGDIDHVPHRVAAGYPGDLYYSDLDGDWNLDGDGTWGEPEDGVDLYPDVFVGRLPVADTVAAGNAVRKIIAYERADSAGYQTKLLFIGADLDAQTPTGQVKDSIQAWHVAAYTGLSVEKLYPSTPTALGRSSVLAALDAGCNLVNFSDHADYYSMGTGLRTGGGQIYPSDAARLANAGRPAVLYTIGCYNGAFD
ncbi:hypothetical protein EG831_07480, partial [bacterium]|nr:hypothetical protein [bacterium]